MASQNVVEAVAELGSKAYRELAELRERVQQLEAAEEGAREAFEHVVQQKQDAQAKVRRLDGLLQAAYGDIRRLTEMRDRSVIDFAKFLHSMPAENGWEVGPARIMFDAHGAVIGGPLWATQADTERWARTFLGGPNSNYTALRRNTD